MARYQACQPLPPPDTRDEVTNRAPCISCGKGMVACSNPSDPATVYWRHDLQDRVLEDEGGGRWRLAEVQHGPLALIARANMAELVERYRA